MAYERRGRRSYYYRKVRENGRVRSLYIGSGELAATMAEQVAARKLLRES